MTNPLHPLSVVALLPLPRGGCTSQPDHTVAVVVDEAVKSPSWTMATRHVSGVLCSSIISTTLSQSLLVHRSRYCEDLALEQFWFELKWK